MIKSPEILCLKFRINLLYFLKKFYFFILINYFFNWRLITLQYCSGFCLHWHESAMGVHVSPSWTPSLFLPHPIPAGSSQCTGPEHPVSCIIGLGLAICFTYDNTRFNAILSNHPTLAFSHRVQKSVLDICVSFAVLHIGSLLPSF